MREKTLKMLRLAVNDTACRLFADECHINPSTFSVIFPSGENIVKIVPRKEIARQADRLVRCQRERIAQKCAEWGLDRVEIWSDSSVPTTLTPSTV